MDDKHLEHEIEHLMLGMRTTDPQRFAELCEELGVDPQDFGKFIAADTKKQDN